MAPQPTLRPSTPADITPCAAIAYAAFQPSALIRQMAPISDEVELGFWTAIVAAAFKDANTHLVVADDAASGEVLGFAKWVFVGEGDALPGIARNVLGGLVGDKELAKAYFGAQAQQHERFMGGRAHWYLELISTKPEIKGLGTGRKLVQWGVEKVDGDGVEAYLEASPQGRGLFERFGFEIVEKLVYLDEGYVECSMVRAAKGKGE
ncbi:acyl-CoA N-acyltransferase [Chaetomium tenue]|uniref:Acyl-CoA N-acyltransferase n=1 Tax=Chaetomium tenue TaxID=1854479 RepID=A0ACB7PI44_9PEZI|nr:acyl-CoA N-acyltransferase [Chaetomium globosum]